MRDIPYDMKEKLQSRIQTRATGAQPKLSLWISRKTTQLTDSVFLESADVAEGDITDCSVAVRHMKFGSSSDLVFIAYVQNGRARITSSPLYTEMSRHTWTDCGFAQSAEAVAIAFDGTMPRNTRGQYEFVTEEVPWIFWVQEGAVYGKKLDGPVVKLAENNATRVSAVRAMWSDVPGFDFGLVLFMIINGTIHYRQLIGGVWSDAEPVPASALPSGKQWTKISAQRTWDYRVALQLLADDGSFCEVFTQYGGIGSKNAEHIEVRDVTSSGALTAVDSVSAAEDEHIGVSAVSGPLYGGLYSLKTPTMVSAYNINDGTGDYGKKAVFVFDVHLKSAEVSAHYAAFTIADSYGTVYIASSAALSEDGKSVELTFTDFNNAYGQCTARYAAGAVSSMADTAVPTTGKTFIPENLVPVNIPFPEVYSIWNE